MGTSVPAGVPNSRMSAPALKNLPLPISTIAFTAGSAAALSTAAWMAFRMTALRPLTGELSRVMTAMAPCNA